MFQKCCSKLACFWTNHRSHHPLSHGSPSSRASCADPYLPRAECAHFTISSIPVAPMNLLGRNMVQGLPLELNPKAVSRRRISAMSSVSQRAMSARPELMHLHSSDRWGSGSNPARRSRASRSASVKVASGWITQRPPLLALLIRNMGAAARLALSSRRMPVKTIARLSGSFFSSQAIVGTIFSSFVQNCMRRCGHIFGPEKRLHAD